MRRQDFLGLRRLLHQLARRREGQVLKSPVRPGASGSGQVLGGFLAWVTFRLPQPLGVSPGGAVAVQLQLQFQFQTASQSASLRHWFLDTAHFQPF